MAYINYRTTNPVYAPGLSTYTNTGDLGLSGENGTAMFFVNYTIESDINGFNRKKINNIIADNDSLYDGDTNVIEYKKGDLVIDDIANVYYLDNNLELSANAIGNIVTPTQKSFTLDSSIHFGANANIEYDGVGDASIHFNLSDGDSISGYNYIQVRNIQTGECTMFKI